MRGMGTWAAALVVLLGGVAAAQESVIRAKAADLPVFPAPAGMQAGEGVLPVDRNTRVICTEDDTKLRYAAEVLSRELGGALGSAGGRLTLVAEKDAGKRTGEIVVRTTKNVRLGGEFVEKSGAYRLTVTPTGAAITAHDGAGAFYGALSLLQLFTKTGDGRGEIVCAEVTDYPYHFYRGMRSTLPRGKPREGEITHDQYRDLLRLMAFCRLNHVWLEGCSWHTPLRRHPEMGWTDVLTADQAKEIVGFAERHFLSMDGSLDWQWIYYNYKHLAELNEGETWEDMTKKVRRVGRVNPCPSNPETWKIIFEVMEDGMEVLTGDHYAVAMDEMYQEYQGSRWAACPLCKGKDPVRLWAGMTNRIIAKVLECKKVPILGGGMLMVEHQGWYKDIYKAIDLVENRDRIVIYNWSEGHIRRGAMRIGGKQLKNENFSATPFFKQHGYKDVMHLFADQKWAGRPEMREVNGKLACYGGFVSYYHTMHPDTLKQQGTLARLVFTAQHLWSPDIPKMESEADGKMCVYGEALADAVLEGKSYVEAIAIGRRAWAAPRGAITLKGGALGRPFASTDPAVNLLGTDRGDRTEGTMRIVLPVEEANPKAAYLVLTINDWDQTGEGEIHLNGHEVRVATSMLSNGRDYTFPPVSIPTTWLKFGPEPNELRFVYKSTAGFIVRKAEIIIVDAPANP